MVVATGRLWPYRCHNHAGGWPGLAEEVYYWLVA